MEQWEITDQHYQDEEGGGKAGYKNVSYKISVSNEIITVTDGNSISHYSKCASVAVTPQTSLPKVSFLKGECKVELGAVDLGCTGLAGHTKLDNGRNLVNFPTRDVATIGYAGSAIVRAGNTSRVFWVDRVYVNQNFQNADGQCVVEFCTDEKSAKLECRAVMKDGRKIVAELTTQDGTRSFLEATAQVVVASPH